MTWVILAPSEVLDLGLSYLRLETRRWSEKKKNEDFKSLYGSSPSTVAMIWSEMIQSTKILKEEERNSFKSFMVAMHYLWARPKNSTILAVTMGISERDARGAPLWDWIKRIARLQEKKIDSSLTMTEKFAISADGVDFKVWEKKHPRYNIDKKACSHKFNSCAAKYLIALSLQESKVVFIAGPYIGGVSDTEMMVHSGLQDLLIEKKKLVMVDRGFHSDIKLHRETHAYPDEIDNPKLHNFKSRARLRQEAFNGKLKKFSIMEQTFKHKFEKHKFVFEAVVVIVQFQMENGQPLFSV